MKKVFLCIFWLIAGKILMFAQPTGHIDVLFVGNSFSFYNGMDQMMLKLAQAAGKDLSVDSYFWGGQTMLGFKNDTSCIAKIKSKAWNYVILEGWDDPAADMRDNGTYLMDQLRSVSPDAKVLMYMVHSWTPYPDDATMNSQQTIFEAIHTSRPYADLVPAEWAWRQGYIEDPKDADWLDPGDNWHPGPRRSYLAAVSIYASIYLTSPVGLNKDTYNYPGEIHLTQSDATYLQNIALNSLNNHSTIGYFLNATSVPVTRVKIAPASWTMEVYEKKQFSDTIAPANAHNRVVSWSSSNSAVATVSSGGLVKGIQTGTTIITVTTADGNKSAYCNVTVTPATGTKIPAKIEAEDFIGQSGVQTASTTDTGGGNCVGYVDDNDWMEYLINVPSAGKYNLDLRLAAITDNRQIQILSGSNVLATINVPNTGGWQTWQTVSTSVTLSAGTQTIRISALTGGWNCNWIEFISPLAVSFTNPGFEADGATQTPSSWSEGFTTANSYTEAGSGSHGGTYHLTHWSGSAFEVSTFREITGLTNGTYSLKAWFVSSGGQTTCQLRAKGFGGTDLAANISAASTWTQVEIQNINVTNGKCTIEYYTKGNAGNWSCMDDVELTQNAVSNQAPTCSITSPANNTPFTVPASITINATASDADGTISKVEFYQGTTLLGTSTSSPYSYTWTNVPGGTYYSLSVKATDNLGATTTSASINVTVNDVANTSPTCSITDPANNATFTAPANITINASASDADGTVSKVEFYQESTLLGSDTSSPYSFSWTNVAAGTYSLTVKATDNANAVTTSAAVSITVNAALSIPGKIEAENYNAMSGVQTETTSDTNGGLNVGYLDAGDWMDYNVNVPTAGTYIINYRVAANAAGQLQLKEGTTVIHSVDIAATGGWQSWTTVSGSATFTAGNHTLRIYVSTPGWNINWFEGVASGTITNPGFEANGASQTPTAWSESTDVASSFSEAGGYSGSYRLAHWSTNAYTVSTYQTVNNLPNGTYTLSAWYTGGGGQTVCTLGAKDFGGTTQTVSLSALNYSWTQKSITGIVVTNNKITIEIYSQANAGNWLRVDDIALTKTKSAEAGSVVNEVNDATTGSFEVYPLPLTESFTIETKGFKDPMVTVYNLQGQIMLKNQIHGEVSQLSSQGLLKGMYIISVDDGLNECRKKILK